MSDPYEPKLATFVLTAAEMGAITAAMATDNPWGAENDDIKSAKGKIREFHLARQSHTCCYCRTILQGGGPFMIDREHILPKKKYKPYTYTLWNLSIACKRCNMEHKGEDDTFVVDKTNTAPFQTGANYRIIHPNYDHWDDHLVRLTLQVNTAVLVKYAVLASSAKGRFTYEFFELKMLETNSFDEAQGKATPMMVAVTQFALEAMALAAEYGQ